MPLTISLARPKQTPARSFNHAGFAARVVEISTACRYQQLEVLVQSLIETSAWCIRKKDAPLLCIILVLCRTLVSLPGALTSASAPADRHAGITSCAGTVCSRSHSA